MKEYITLDKKNIRKLMTDRRGFTGQTINFLRPYAPDVLKKGWMRALEKRAPKCLLSDYNKAYENRNILVKEYKKKKVAQRKAIKSKPAYDIIKAMREHKKLDDEFAHLFK